VHLLPQVFNFLSISPEEEYAVIRSAANSNNFLFLNTQQIDNQQLGRHVTITIRKISKIVMGAHFTQNTSFSRHIRSLIKE